MDVREGEAMLAAASIGAVFSSASPDFGANGVVDRFGLSHEVPNLAILGGSVMGSCSAHNPTHTLQALAWRTADHIVAQWKTLAPGA